MIPKEAIKKAIEGGWRGLRDAEHQHDVRCDKSIALDPSFWQSLGKALGWGEMTVPVPDTFGGEAAYHTDDKWMFEAHAFFSLILTGGDTKAFWDELLAPNKTP